MKTIYKKAISAYFGLMLAATIGFAGVIPSSADTAVLKFKNEVKVVVVADARDDLKSVLEYDMNKVMEDLQYRIDWENQESAIMDISSDFGRRFMKDTTITQGRAALEKVDYDMDDDDRDRKRSSRRRARSFTNIDIGLNNVLKPNNTFPSGSSTELYAVRPVGSWYFGFSSLFKVRIAGPLHITWGGGVDWYSFKFEDHLLRITRDDVGLQFFQDLRPNINGIKSKLSASYLNVRVVPSLEFGGRGGRGSWLWSNDGNEAFRIGFGGYAGYRLDSWTKAVYREEGDNSDKKDKEKSSYYLENFRYGVRGELGFKSVDLFVSYDLNELFLSSKDTPQLNAFAFGISF